MVSGGALGIGALVLVLRGIWNLWGDREYSLAILATIVFVFLASVITGYCLYIKGL